MRAVDEADFSAWAEAARPDLRRMAYLMCGDWTRADDVTQDALVRLYLRWGRLEHRGGLRTYARRVLMSAFVDERRRPWRRESLVVDAGDVRTEPVDPHDGPRRVEDRMLVLSALAALPPRQRACVVLRWFDELSVDETAAALAVTTGTVKSQTSKAMVHLRGLLDPYSTGRIEERGRT